jgi:hypothetical protein
MVDAEATTVKLTAGLVTTSGTVAVILVIPAAIPVAKPDDVIVAVVGVSLDHITSEVISSVEPSVKVPVAVNC